VWSLFPATSVFCPRAHLDARSPRRPVFLAYVSPQAATFPVLLFAFAASQDNHYPLKFRRQVRFCPQRLLRSNNPTLPETPLGKQPVFGFASFQFKCGLMPCHTVWRPRAQHWLGLLALPAGEQLSPYCPSWDGLGQQGDGSAGPHIPNVSLFVQPQEACRDHHTQVFSSGKWAALPKTRKPDCQASPLWRAESRALPYHPAAAEARQHQPFIFHVLQRTRNILQIKMGK